MWGSLKGSLRSFGCSLGFGGSGLRVQDEALGVAVFGVFGVWSFSSPRALLLSLRFCQRSL